MTTRFTRFQKEKPFVDDQSRHVNWHRRVVMSEEQRAAAIKAILALRAKREESDNR